MGCLTYFPLYSSYHFLQPPYIFVRNLISSLSLTLTSAAAALKLIFATDSLLRLRGSRLRPERELVKEQREAAPGVMGV